MLCQRDLARGLLPLASHGILEIVGSQIDLQLPAALSSSSPASSQQQQQQHGDVIAFVQASTPCQWRDALSDQTPASCSYSSSVAGMRRIWTSAYLSPMITLAHAATAARHAVAGTFVNSVHALPLGACYSTAAQLAMPGGTTLPSDTWKEVHKQLQGCSYSWQELADTVQRHEKQLDAQALELALDKVVRLVQGMSTERSLFEPQSLPTSTLQQEPQTQPIRESAADVAHLRRQILDTLGASYMQQLPSMAPAASVDLLHSFAVLGCHPGKDAKALLDLCRHMREVAMPGLKELSPEYTVNMLWAVGKLSSLERVQLEEQELGTRAVDPELFAQAARMLFPRVSSLQSRYLSKLTQACSMAAIYYYPVLCTTLTAARVKLAEFDSASLTNLTRCLSMLNHPDDSFYPVVAERMRIGMRQLSGHHVVTLVKAFATLKYNNEAFYMAASQKLQMRMSELGPSQVTNIAWSYAVRNIQDIKLYNNLAFRSGSIIGKFKPYELSMLAWSFARQGMVQRALLDMVAKEALRNLDGYNMKNMSNLVWAFAQLGVPSPQLFAAVGERAARMLEDPEGRFVERSDDGVEVYRDNSGRTVERYRDTETERLMERVHLKDGTELLRAVRSSANRLYVPQNLSDMAWAFSEQGHADQRLFGLIAQRAMADIHLFGKTSLVDLAVGCAQAKFFDPQLFRAIEEFSKPSLSDFGPAYMSEILWAMAELGHKPSEDFIATSVEVTWIKWERVTADRDWLGKTVWALLKLGAKDVMPGHPLLAAFNDVLAAANMQDATMVVTSPAGGVAGSGGASLQPEGSRQQVVVSTQLGQSGSLVTSPA